MNVLLFLFGWPGEIKGKKTRKASRGKAKKVHEQEEKRAILLVEPWLCQVFNENCCHSPST